MTGLIDVLTSRSPFARAVALVLLILSWVLMVRVQSDPDFWWHLRVADYVLDHNDVPRTDFLSWQAFGEPWIAHSWLHDLAMGAAMRIGGLFGVAVLGSVIAALVLILLDRLFARVAPETVPILRAGAVLAAVVIGGPVWSPRAQVWDVVFLAVAVIGWLTYRDTGRRTWLVAMVPAGWVWANLHGSGIGAYWAAAAVLAFVIFARWLPPGRSAWPLVSSVGLTILAMALGPYGPALLAYPFETIFSSTQASLIQEWQAPDLSERTFVGLRIALVAIPVVIALGRKRPDFLIGLLAVAWGWLALGSARYVALAAPFIAAVGLVSLEAVRTRRGRSLSNERSGGRLPAYAVLLAVPVLALAAFMRVSPAASNAAISGAFPVAAAVALVERACVGRIWNAYGWGGYLSYRWRGLVGMYGAADSLGDARLEAQIRQATDGDTFQHALERDGIVLAVVGPRSIPAARLAVLPGWTRIAGDGVGELWAAAGACR